MLSNATYFSMALLHTLSGDKGAKIRVVIFPQLGAQNPEIRSPPLTPKCSFFSRTRISTCGYCRKATLCFFHTTTGVDFILDQV